MSITNSNSSGHSRWTHDSDSNFISLRSFLSKSHFKSSNSIDHCPCQGTNLNDYIVANWLGCTKTKSNCTICSEFSGGTNFIEMRRNSCNRVMTRVTYQNIPVTRAVFRDLFPLTFVRDSPDSTRALKWEKNYSTRTKTYMTRYNPATKLNGQN